MKLKKKKKKIPKALFSNSFFVLVANCVIGEKNSYLKERNLNLIIEKQFPVEKTKEKIGIFAFFFLSFSKKVILYIFGRIFRNLDQFFLKSYKI